MRSTKIIFTLSVTIIFLIEGTLQKTLQDALMEKICDRQILEEKISDNIINYTVKMYPDILKKMDNICSVQAGKYAKYELYMIKNTANYFQQMAKDLREKIKLTKSFISLPQYYIIKYLQEQDSTCITKSFANQLGPTYEKCDLCSGQFFEMDLEWLSIQRDIISPVYTSRQSSLWRFEEGRDQLQPLMMRSFQLLWNCNNPNDKIEVTGILDEASKEKLNETPITGFSRVCATQNLNVCDQQTCIECSIDYKTCYKCKDGFIPKNGSCVPCSYEKCSLCQLNQNLQEVCLRCKGNLVLNGQECIGQCPDKTHNLDNVCITCNEGTFFNGKKCASCSPFCQKCSGPSEKQCAQCVFGFIQDEQGNCNVCQDENKCPGGVCLSSQYRSLVQPHECANCDAKCKTCSNFGPNNCTSCFDGDRLVGGRCTNINYKPSTYVDPITKKIKQCNFSCSQCDDPSIKCIECNPDQNFYINVGDRKICFNQCPLNYVAIEGDLIKDFYECRIISSYNSDIKAADVTLVESLTKCAESFFWDNNAKSCLKCQAKCLSCNSLTQCNSCASGYYWDSNIGSCLPCHSSCKQCSGPLSSHCIYCINPTSIYPQNGVCDASQSSSQLNTKVISSQDLFNDLNKCQVLYSENDKKSYSISLNKIFSTQDSQWKNNSLLSKDSTCSFNDFKSKYSKINKSTTQCTQNQIQQPTMSNSGQMTTVYATLLANLGVQIGINTITPATLAQYAVNYNLYRNLQVFNPKGEFSCNQISCSSEIESNIRNLMAPNSKIASIKKDSEIIFTSNGKQLQCNPSIFSSKIDQMPIQQFLVHSQQQKNTQLSMKYYVLEACVSDSNNVVSKKIFITLDISENQFIRAASIDSTSEADKESIFFLQGASKNNNDYLKKCNPKYKNSYSQYIITKVKVIEVIQEERTLDKVQSAVDQASTKVNINSIIYTKRTDCVSTPDYILQNEGRGREFIRAISPQGTFISQSINIENIKNELKAQNINPVQFRDNKQIIGEAQARIIFEEYVKKMYETAKQCFGFDGLSLCIQNILTDIVFSNKGQCFSQQQISEAARQTETQTLITLLSTSDWCKINSERCNKHIQVLSGGK